MMGVCTRNMSSYDYVNKITLLHEVGISNYFMRKMHGQTILKLLYDTNTDEACEIAKTAFGFGYISSSSV